MRSLFRPRRLVLACAVSAVGAAGLMAPGAAFALPGHCEGAQKIKGEGSTFQRAAEQEVWNPDFNASSNPLSCTGGGVGHEPKVTYGSVGSGRGLESWGVEPKGGIINFGPENAFFGTDNAPTEAQKAEIEKLGGEAGKGTVLTIPVEEASEALDINLPEGCTATSTAAPGRLVLSDKVLEAVFQGTKAIWKDVKGGGDALSCGSKAATKAALASEIHRVVRKDGSGTTAIFMKFLNVEKKGKPVFEGKSWFQLGQVAANTTWPEEVAHPVTRGQGNVGVAAEVAAHAGSIGYVNLAESRKNGAFTPGPGKGGAGTKKFWAELANSSTTYADPSDNGDAEASANSNCAETVYTNGTKKFPPPTAHGVWDEVTAQLTQKNYALCGLTYVVLSSKYSAFTAPGTLGAEPTSEGEVTSVRDFFKWVLADKVSSGSAGGGQEVLEGKDYLGLPENPEPSKNVRLIAEEGVNEVRF